MSSKPSIDRKRPLFSFAKVINKPDTQPSLLLALPYELRIVVYEFILLDSHKTGIHGYNTHPLYALLFVNQSLRIEASEQLYKRPIFKFASPDRCLFFLNWTAPDVQKLRGLRISVPTHDTYSLEPIFNLLLEVQVPLEKLALEFLNINSAAERPPKKRVLPEQVGKEALRQARDRSDYIEHILGAPLDPGYKFCPNNVETAVGKAQCSTASSLGRLATLRYLETDDEPIGYWAVEFELASLRLKARMLDIAANEGRKVEFRRLTSGTRGYRVVDLRRRKGQEWKHKYWWFLKENLWMDGRYGIEGVIMEEAQELARMGTRDVDEFTLCPQEKRIGKALRALGLTKKILSREEREVQENWRRFALIT